MKPPRRGLPVLAGLVLGVVLLHGWLIEAVAARARPALPELPATVPLAVRTVALHKPAEPAEATERDAAVSPEAVAAPAREMARGDRPVPAQMPKTAPPVRERAERPLAAAVPPSRVAPNAEVVQVAEFEAIAPEQDQVSPEQAQASPDQPLVAAMQLSEAQAPQWLVAAAAAAPAASAARSSAAPAADAPPVYRTRIPPAARLSYRLSRGALVGIGELDWQPQPGGTYSLRLEGKLPPLGTLIVQTSRGRFDAAGLAPERHTDKRMRRGEQAANFQRDKGIVSFSGPSTELPLLAGTQDRLSVMLQLAAIANAWKQPPPVGDTLRIQVVGARGDGHVWALRYDGPQSVRTADGTVAALRFVREPAGPYDTRAEFWLDGTRSYLPVRVRLTDGRGDVMELLREGPVPPP